MYDKIAVMINLSELSFEKLVELCVEIGEEPYRAKQIQDWLYLKSARDIADMKNISTSFREKLSKIAVLAATKVIDKQLSADGTLKYLLEFEDGARVETVLMRFDNRANLTACVSSQAGCKMGCDFCATGKYGFKGNLKASEIVEQILTIQADTSLKVTNVVFMGQGEPLDNYDEVYAAIETLNQKLQIGIRRICVSTCGIIPKIAEFASKKLVPTLAISLHAPNSDIRDTIMPINKKYNMEALKQALIAFNAKTGDRVTIEYILLEGINNTPEHALELSKYLKEIKCNVNLIPYNGIGQEKYKKPSQKAISHFKLILEQGGKKVTQRLERGSDIKAACGQLANTLRADKSA